MPVYDDLFRLYRKDPVSFIRDILGVKLRSYQVEYLMNLDEHGLHRWCRQSGKNMTIYLTSIWKAVFYPNTKIVIGTRHSSTAFTIRELEIVAEKAAHEIGKICGVTLKHLHRKLEFSNGSVILLSHNMFREEADYLIGNYDIYLPPEIEKEHKFKSATKLHIFEAEPLDISINTGNGDCPVIVQVVNWRGVHDNDPEWARNMLNYIGEKAFRLHYLATEDDIAELSK